MTRNISRILVTGGAGFIGSHIVDRLLRQDIEVVVIDNLTAGSMRKIAQHKRKSEFHFMKGDILDFPTIRRIMKGIDAVFHEAALASVTLSMKNPLLANEINVKGTLNLLKASSDLGVKRFIYASTAAVYGDTENPQKEEDMPTNPNSPYGISKLAAENYVRIFQSLYGLETVSLRYFNVYGPRQRFDINCAYGGVITIFLNRLLKNMLPIIFGDGEQTRDFIFIDDVVEANMLALNNRDAPGSVFNIGTGIGVSVNQIAELLKELLSKKNLKNIHKKPRPGESRHGYADISKAEKTLGFHPKFDIKKGLTDLIDWYKSSHNHRI
jgi:nucleoside-diphosphate-sugar epimerase